MAAGMVFCKEWYDARVVLPVWVLACVSTGALSIRRSDPMGHLGTCKSGMAVSMHSNNMLYPKESEGRTLVFACRQCSFIEPTADKCVYRNEFGKSQS
jgi:hypothetical protein